MSSNSPTLSVANIQAEQAVIGGLMRDNAVWDTVAERIGEADFFRDDHKLIFHAIRTLSESQRPFDFITVAETLERADRLSDAGNFGYITALHRDTASTANISAYADIVADMATRRRIMSAGQAIHELPTTNATTAEMLQRIEDIVSRLMPGPKKSQWQSYRDVIGAAVERIESAFSSEGHITGTPTGFLDFDDQTTGLQAGDLVIVAGRPGMGKTTWAIQVAENIATRQKKPVAIFSQEMPSEQLGMRSLASGARINLRVIRTGKLSDNDWPWLTMAITKFASAPIYVDDSPALSPTDIRARLKRLVAKTGQFGVVVVDYLQLMRVPGMGNNRVQEVSEISRTMKAIAKEFSVPVLALSQLNRELEKRTNKRPVMADLRESGSLEQDADIIVFIYRDEVYNPETTDKGVAEIIIGKQRNGPLGTIRLMFEGQYTRFENGPGAKYEDVGVDDYQQADDGF